MDAAGIHGAMAHGLRINLLCKDMNEITEGALKIRDLRAPFFVGRNGTIELEVISFWLLHRRGDHRRLYPQRLKDQIQRNAGIFPATGESIDAWCEKYTELLGLMNGGAAGWYQPLKEVENIILKLFAPNSFRTPLRSLEPYYVEAEARWTQKLAGKRVTVVSSFADTMQSQIKRAKELWTGEQDGLLDISGVTWSFVKTGYAPITASGIADWPIECSTWQSAVKYVVNSVTQKHCEVALIGCGGLGMIIAGRLKELGISSIVLGGSIQVLFGIKGRRWATHDVISKFWNKSWISPSRTEIPGGAGLVEGGCYWL